MSAYAVSFLDGQNIKMLNGNPDGWEVVTLEDLCTDIRAGFPSGERSDNGIIQLRMNNITTDGHVSLKSYLRVPLPSDIEAYLLKSGDILFNNTNSVELVGKSAVFKLNVITAHSAIISLELGLKKMKQLPSGYY